MAAPACKAANPVPSPAYAPCEAEALLMAVLTVFAAANAEEETENVKPMRNSSWKWCMVSEFNAASELKLLAA